MQEASSDPLIGSTVDARYLVLSKVADGGMSTVYLAKDLRLGRNIALKILPPRLANDSAFIAALGTEAASAASLSHPHVVQIHDHSVSPEHAYLVYEYIDGRTLRNVIDAEGAMSPRRALDLLDPVVEGLAAAHNASLVHRDVKPENVLISRDGWVKIGDFGLSHAVNAANHTGDVMGTVHYIAPELALHQGSDARTDIYSAGIVLYELLTGRQPFHGSKAEVAAAHVHQSVPAPSLVVPGLPGDMDELVRYMTARDPDHRPANGAALLEDLRHIRATLTPAELDFSTNTTESLPPPQPSPGQYTEVMSAVDATGVIAAPYFPTSILPQPVRLYPEDSQPVHDAVEPGMVPSAGQLSPTSADVNPQAPLSKRQAAVQAKTQAKARAKSAATPLTTLGPQHPRRRAVIWSVLIAALIVLAATAGWYLGMGPGALASVPDVHNKSVSQAQVLLRTAGFERASTSEVFDEKVAEGFIVNTDPTAGESVRKFRAITLLVSRGPVLHPVPAVVGTMLPEATTALNQGNLALGSVTETFDEKVPAGVVLGQDPAAGKEFRTGTLVNLVVSKGPEPIPVPALSGMSEPDAVAALQAVGLVAAVAPEKPNSRDVAAGMVLSQSPATGDLKAGDTVTLTLSAGPRMIEVPNVVGKQVGVATKELEALGFTVNSEPLLGGFFGTVRFQTPGSGEAAEGSVIELKYI